MGKCSRWMYQTWGNYKDWPKEHIFTHFHVYLIINNFSSGFITDSREVQQRSPDRLELRMLHLTGSWFDTGESCIFPAALWPMGLKENCTYDIHIIHNGQQDFCCLGSSFWIPSFGSPPQTGTAAAHSDWWTVQQEMVPAIQVTLEKRFECEHIWNDSLPSQPTHPSSHVHQLCCPFLHELASSFGKNV